MRKIVRDMHDKNTQLTAFIRLQSLTLTGLLAACGGGGTTSDTTSGGGVQDEMSDNDSLQGPVSDVVNVSQPYDLQPAVETADWVEALHGEEVGYMKDLADDGTAVIHYIFPSQRPFYLFSEDRQGWEEATAEMEAAFEDVFMGLEAVFNIDFVETSSVVTPNTIAIQVNEQDDMNSAAYAYYPSIFPIGFDIFLDNDFDTPTLTNGLTNYDYETLVHELGHSLGLKHPFDDEGGTALVLPAAADTSQWTVMTYTDVEAYFDGFFRGLDLMALADIYGVNPSFRAGDDTYEFSTLGGTFVIDGNGVDTIDASSQTANVRINLTSETVSYVANKGATIVSPNQLTISADTDIENAIGGTGDDYLIGNVFDNVLTGNAGNDEIYAGLGEDRIEGGTGDDIIDLSEATTSEDVYVLLSPIAYNGADLVYNFDQGGGGDVVSHTLLDQASLLSVVQASVDLTLDITGDILRLIGTGIEAATDLVTALSDGGALAGVDIDEGDFAFIILADTDAAGETQTLFAATLSEGVYEATILTAFVGDDVDIDLWSGANFDFV